MANIPVELPPNGPPFAETHPPTIKKQLYVFFNNEKIHPLCEKTTKPVKSTASCEKKKNGSVRAFRRLFIYFV